MFAIRYQAHGLANGKPNIKNSKFSVHGIWEIDDNPENRDNARIRYKSPVTIENLQAGIIYQARMLNFSKFGLYFESDSLLGLGDEVFIGIEYSP